jgi:hypothetical protein
MNTYLDDSLKDKLKQLRIYETETRVKWGNLKRIYKMVGVDFEIKFLKAEQLLKTSLREDPPKKQIAMVEMMLRAYEQLNIKCEESGYIMIQPNAKCFTLDKKTALICDTDDEKPVLELIHKNEKDIMIFSIEELLRCIPNDFMKAKELLSKLDKSVNIQRVDYV